MTMNTKRSFGLKLLAAGGALVVIAFVWWWHVTGVRQATVLAALPPVPDLSTVPGMMRERIMDADTRARNRRHAQEGMAELAQLYHANGFLEEAAGCYAGLAALQPTEPRWPHLHATILAGYGDAGPAIALWRRVTELAPDYVPARIRLGDCLLKANRTDEASAAYEAVLKIEPAQAHALFGLARIDYEAERWDQARQRLEIVVNSTNYQLGYDLIVTLYERLGVQDRARAIRGRASASGAYRDPADPWLDGLVEYCFDPFRLTLHAGVLGRMGDRTTAQRLLERAIELVPNDVAARFQLGTLAVEQGNAKLATEQLERCTMLAPDFADGWAHLSSLQAQQGNSVAAERTLAAGLKNCPQSPGLHLMRARNLRKAGRAEEAINEYLISARLRPNEPEAYLELGNTYIGLSREEEGIAQIRAALQAEPENPTALSILAYHAITRADESEAREWMGRVANQPRVTPETVSALTRAYRQRFGRDFN
jgi:tetratricopeptide (TPR) repeat protein